MSYATFCLILIAGVLGSIMLALWPKELLPKWRPSWLAVPYPFFIAWIIVTWDWVRLIFLWHQ